MGKAIGTGQASQVIDVTVPVAHTGITNEAAANYFMDIFAEGKNPAPPNSWVQIDLAHEKVAALLHDGVNSGFVVSVVPNSEYPVDLVYVELNQGHTHGNQQSEDSIRVWTPENIIGLERPMEINRYHLETASGDRWDACTVRTNISAAELSWVSAASLILFSLSSCVAGKQIWNGPGKLSVSCDAGPMSEVLVAAKESAERYLSMDTLSVVDPVVEEKKGFFAKLFPGKGKAAPEIDLVEYERISADATRGYNNILSMQSEDVSEQGYTQVKRANFEAGKLAHDSKTLPEQLRAYYPIHFLAQSGWLVSNFESDFKTGISHLTGAAQAFADLESNVGFPDQSIAASIQKIGATYRNQLNALEDAFTLAGYRDPNDPMRQTLARQAIEIHKASKYPLDEIWHTAFTLSCALLSTATKQEDFQLVLAPIGTAMNFLTASMEWGSRPYNAVREVVDAGELFDYSLIALCGAGHIETAVEIFETAQFSEIEKPWREAGGVYASLLDRHAELLAQCPKFLFADAA